MDASAILRLAYDAARERIVSTIHAVQPKPVPYFSFLKNLNLSDIEILYFCDGISVLAASGAALLR